MDRKQIAALLKQAYEALLTRQESIVNASMDEADALDHVGAALRSLGVSGQWSEESEANAT
jgi:hypothetical protein